MDHEEATIYSEVVKAKVVTMVVLFCCSMVTGCLPMLISIKYDCLTSGVSGDMKSSNKLVAGLLAFGGGVLFCTSFLHLLPELNENIQLLQESGQLPRVNIFLAGLIMCCGFFMMYLIEELVHAYIESRETKNEGDTSFTRTLSIRKKSGIDIHDEIENNGFHNSNGHGHSHFKEASHSHSHIVDTKTGEGDSIVIALRGLLIVLALSIHELFEGLAVGLESSARNVWYMFGAVSAHKFIIAFCIGVELLAANTKRWLSVVYIFTFSFVSALGIGIGILLVGGSGAAEAGIVSVVLQGIACGTLVYVVFFEVWGKDKAGFAHFFCALLGFSLMALLELFLG